MHAINYSKLKLIEINIIFLVIFGFRLFLNLIPKIFVQILILCRFIKESILLYTKDLIGFIL